MHHGLLLYFLGGGGVLGLCLAGHTYLECVKLVQGSRVLEAGWGLTRRRTAPGCEGRVRGKEWCGADSVRQYHQPAVLLLLEELGGMVLAGKVPGVVVVGGGAC